MNCPPYPYSLVDETTFNIPRMKFQGKVPGELAEMGNILEAEGMNRVMNWEIKFRNHLFHNSKRSTEKNIKKYQVF